MYLTLGDFTPRSSEGRTFVVYYALFGLGLLTYILAVISEAVTKKVEKHAQKINEKKFKQQNRQNKKKQQQQQQSVGINQTSQQESLQIVSASSPDNFHSLASSPLSPSIFSSSSISSPMSSPNDVNYHFSSSSSCSCSSCQIELLISESKNHLPKTMITEIQNQLAESNRKLNQLRQHLQRTVEMKKKQHKWRGAVSGEAIDSNHIDVFDVFLILSFFSYFVWSDVFSCCFILNNFNIGYKRFSNYNESNSTIKSNRY